MSIRKKILINNDILNGNPHIEGTRITIFDIISDCKHSSVEIFLESWKEISVSDLRNVLKYCKFRQCENDGSHCGGCSLRLKQDGIYSQEDFINRFAEVRFANSNETLLGNGQGVMVMPGTPESLSQTWSGEDGWLMASELLDEIDAYI